MGEPVTRKPPINLGAILAFQSRKRFAKDAVLIVDGTLVPARDHAIAEQSQNRYSTNHQVLVDTDSGMTASWKTTVEVGDRPNDRPTTRLPRSQVGCGIRHVRDVVAAENLTPITWTRRDGFMFSDDPADWIEYEKRQFRQILGRLTQMITGTLDPHLARYPDDEWAQFATARLTGVRATLAQLSKPRSPCRARHDCCLPSPPLPVRHLGCRIDTPEPLLPVPACQTKTGGHPENWPRWEIVDGIRYVVDNGAKWRALPADSPPWETAYGFF